MRAPRGRPVAVALLAAPVVLAALSGCDGATKPKAPECTTASAVPASFGTIPSATLALQFGAPVCPVALEVDGETRTYDALVYELAVGGGGVVGLRYRYLLAWRGAGASDRLYVEVSVTGEGDTLRFVRANSASGPAFWAGITSQPDEWLPSVRTGARSASGGCATLPNPVEWGCEPVLLRFGFRLDGIPPQTSAAMAPRTVALAARELRGVRLLALTP